MHYLQRTIEYSLDVYHVTGVVSRYLANKGLALYHVGRKEDAFIWIDKALSIDPINQQIVDLKAQMQEIL